MEKDAVRRLIRLMEFRNNYPAFNGDFIIEDTPEDRLSLTWENSACRATVDIDLNSYQTVITYTDPDTDKKKSFTV